MKSMEEMIAAAQKAAETIQSQMNDMQAKLDAIEVEGTAGGGLVKVRASARGRIIGVTIDESLLTPEEKQIIEDLVTGRPQRRPRQGRPGFGRGNAEGPERDGPAARVQSAGDGVGGVARQATGRYVRSPPAR